MIAIRIPAKLYTQEVVLHRDQVGYDVTTSVALAFAEGGSKIQQSAAKAGDQLDWSRAMVERRSLGLFDAKCLYLLRVPCMGESALALPSVTVVDAEFVDE